MGTQLYNLEWMLDGIVKETILTNVPRPVAIMKKGILKGTTHTSGLLIIKKVNNK